MNSDATLKKEDMKMILLICGNPKTGKKTLVNSWIKDEDSRNEEKAVFKVYYFNYQEKIDNILFEIPCEIRILNSDEIDTELKINNTFFKGALGAFVVTSADDYVTFEDGIKWKEKLDLMCCLPNKFPLPIFLIVNKCDKVNKGEHKWMEKDQIEQYSLENQFFNHHLLSLEQMQYKETIEPLNNIIKGILNFKDLKEKLLRGQLGKGSLNNTGEQNETVLLMNDKPKGKDCVII